MSSGGTDRSASHALSLRTVVWFVASLMMLQPLATDLFLPTLPGIATYFDAPVATVQWTLSAFVGAFALWQLIAGPMSDRFGRYPVIVGGALSYCAGSLICMAAFTIEVLIAGRVLQAIGACSALVGARALVRDLYEPQQGARVLASASTVMGFAPLLGPLLGAQAYALFGWRSAFSLLSLFALALTVAALWRLHETNARKQHDALRLAPMLRNYAAIARSPVFRAYALAASSSYAGLFVFISGSSFVLIRIYQLPAMAFALAFSTMVAGYIVGTVICRRLLGRFGAARTLQAGAALQAGAGLTLAALSLLGVLHPLAIVVPMFFFGIAHGMIQPPAQAGAAGPFPRNAGAASALMGCTMMAIASLVGFWIGASYNNTVFPLTLTICATSVVGALIAFTLVRKHAHAH